MLMTVQKDTNRRLEMLTTTILASKSWNKASNDLFPGVWWCMKKE